MLTLREVSLTLSGHCLLQNIHCNIQAGELVVILGPNGAGKSSLLKVASGELAATSGEVLLQGQPLSSISYLDKALRMAVLPQQSSLDFPFLAREVVGLSRIPHATGAKVDQQIVDEALKTLDVWHLAEQLYVHLSGGEKQRVQLARILAQLWQQPGVLMLDEPNSALDFSHQQQVMKLLQQRARQGQAVIMVLHDLNLAASFADKIILMDAGKIVAQGTAEEVLQESLLKQVFNLDFYRISHPETGKQLFVN